MVPAKVPDKASLKFGAKGRMKSKLQELAETKPSPHGIRVQPVIDPALKARLTAAEKKPSKLVCFFCMVSTARFTSVVWNNNI